MKDENITRYKERGDENYRHFAQGVREGTMDQIFNILGFQTYGNHLKVIVKDLIELIAH